MDMPCRDDESSLAWRLLDALNTRDLEHRHELAYQLLLIDAAVDRLRGLAPPESGRANLEHDAAKAELARMRALILDRDALALRREMDDLRDGCSEFYVG